MCCFVKVVYVNNTRVCIRNLLTRILSKSNNYVNKL